MSPVRVRFAYEVQKTGDGTVTATGHTVHASVDVEGRPPAFPSRSKAVGVEHR